MGRPKRVYPNSLPKYDKLHTRMAKMYSGVQLTILHLIKETNQFFMGFESWAYCSGNFRKLKYGFNLSVNIPTITDKDTIAFLDKRAWKDWVDKSIAENRNNKTEVEETIAFLDRLFPSKKKVFFYELDSIISSFCNGTFISYDDDGKVEEPSEHDIKQRKYYCSKYKMFCKETPELQALYDTYQSFKDIDEAAKDKAFDAYYEAAQTYVYEKYNLTNVFRTIGENAVCCPYAFTRPSVKGSTYEHVGEIYFVVTEETIYFEIKRHY